MGAPLLDYSINLSIYDDTTVVTPTTPQGGDEEADSMLWPMTIMVSGICLLTAAVLVVIILMRRLRLQSNVIKRAKVGDTEIITKGMVGKESMSVVEIAVKDTPSSDRLIRIQRRPTISKAFVTPSTNKV